MLQLPNNPDLIVSIVGIDPGSETLGVAVIYFNLLTFEIVKIEATTFRGSRLYGSEFTGELHGDRYKRLNSHRNNLIEIFNSVNPLGIICESPFYSSRMPSAFGALTEVVCSIREAVMAYDAWRVLYLIDPPSVKKALGCKGNGDKIAVKQALLNMPLLCNAIVGGVESLDEHSIDAIGVGYHLYTQYRDGTMSLI